jgi:hypothetical protein
VPFFFEPSLVACGKTSYTCTTSLIAICCGASRTAIREAFEMTVYYLAWKYLVGFLNQEVGIA